MSVEALFGLLDQYEGGGQYDTLFGYSQRPGGRFAGVDITQMSLDQLRDFSRVGGEYGNWVRDELGRSGQRARIATPMGRGQIVGTTMRNVQDALGLSGDTLFDENTQLQMIDYLARRRLEGVSDPAARRAALRAEWEGFGQVPDAQLDQVIGEYLGGEPFRPGPPTPQGQNALATPGAPPPMAENALAAPQQQMQPLQWANSLDPQAFMSRRPVNNPVNLLG